MEEGGKEELAYITDVGVGMRDCKGPVLWFTVNMLYSSALIIEDWDNAGSIIESDWIHEVKDLEGRACVVRVRNGIVKFVRLHSGGAEELLRKKVEG